MPSHRPSERRRAAPNRGLDRGFRRAGSALLALLLAPVAGAAPAAAAPSLLHRCARGSSAECGRLAVPLDRRGQLPGTLSLAVTRVRATGRSRGVIVALAGGPGQSAVSATGDFASSVGAGLQSNDVVVLDQRGTGLSGLLRCGELENTDGFGLTPSAALCAQRIGPARADYTTRDSVDDLDALRQALGVARISLYATSYGTKVALAYAARYPTRVARLALDSVVGLDGPDAFDADSFAAVPRVLAALCHRACAAITRDPVADLAAVTARLRRGPITGWFQQASGARTLLSFDESTLFSLLVTSDLDDPLRSDLPAALHAAASGDETPLIRAVRHGIRDNEVRGAPQDFSTADYAATTCEETPLPWPRSAPLAARPGYVAAAEAARGDHPFFPFDAATGSASDQIGLCLNWPEATTDPAPSGPVPDVPTLLLSGQEDLRTPLEGARRVAATIRGSELVTVAGTGHSTVGADASGCAARALSRFLADRRPGARCPRIDRTLPLAPAFPSRLRDVRPAPGTSGTSGRTVAAASLTVDDALRTAVETTPTATITIGPAPAEPGLRGGRLVMGDSGLLLEGVVVVAGVRVSGRLLERGGESGRLRITGPDAAAGVLRVDKVGNVSGRLGGRRVRSRLTLPSLAAAINATGSGSSRRGLARRLLGAARHLARRREQGLAELPRWRRGPAG